MKKISFTKRIACLILAVMMAIPVASVANLPEASKVEAASAKNVTMYVGESVDLGYTNSEIKNLKTTNKKVVKKGTFKSSSNYKHSYIEAKKTGKATVTFKRFRKTYTFNIKVKKAKFNATAQQIGRTSRILITIQNKTKQTFENVNVQYTVRNASGTIVAVQNEAVRDVQAKSTAYLEVYSGVSSEVYEAGITCTATVTPDFHQLTGKYTNVSNKIQITNEAKNGKNVDITYMNNNTKTSYTDGCIYVIFYDAAGQVAGFDYTTLYIDKGTTNTRTFYGPYDGYASYKVVVNAWCWK